MADTKTSFELNFHRTVAGLSLRLLKVNDRKTFDEAIDGALAQLGILFDVDRGYLFRYSDDLTTSSNTHEWCAPGISAQKTHLQHQRVDSMPWWMARMKEMRPLHITDLTALPEEAAAEKMMLQAQEIRSLLVMPFSDDRLHLLGFVGFDAVRASRVWPEEQIGMMDVLAEIVGSAIARMDASLALAESESRYRSLLENAPDIITRFDRSFRHTYINKKATEEFGLPVDHFIGKTNRELEMPENMAKQWEAGLRAVFEEKTEQVVDINIATPNGSQHYTSRMVPEYVTGDTVDTVMSITRNITESTHAEEKLREEHEWLEHILNITGTRFDVVDGDFNLHLVDKSWKEIYGDPVGRKCYTYFNGTTEPCLGCGIPRALATKQVVVTEEVLPRENNRIIEVHTIPFRNSAGQWMVAEFNVDITRRKQAEEACANVQKLESLGIFAGGIAHDFNNLMGGIFGYIDMACAKSSDPAVTGYLSKAISTMDRARALTQQLLTFAKGGDPIQKIGPLFPFVQETSQFVLVGSNVSCQYEIQPNLWTANFDKNQIGQVIDNIIINAQQSMPLGGTLYLSARNVTFAENAHPTLENGNYVGLSVRDAGIGIPKELIGRIFDPFFTTKPKGHGLGLATCYSIIKRHGGCIDVDSEPGTGTTFMIYLPAALESVSEKSKVPSKTHTGYGTFLVMDDEEVMRAVIKEMLEAAGYTVICKENGNDVIRFFKENRNITGMMFDLTVPGGMGGMDVIAELRRLDGDIPIFVASGYADDPVMKNPRAYGFTASICKPFCLDDLLALLERHVLASARSVS